MKTPPISFGLKGRVRASVLRGGKPRLRTSWQPNLILDRGMDTIATKVICDIFRVAIKGGTSEATSETVAGSNTFEQTGSTVTRTAGTRDFTSADIGKLIYWVTAQTATKIQSLTSVTEVEVDTVETVAGQDIKLFSVELDWENEIEDGTYDPAITFDKPLGDATVIASGSFFTADMVGQAIYFNNAKAAYIITTYTDVDEVEVDTAPGDEDVSGDTAFVYPVNSESLRTAYSRTATCGSATGDNGTQTTDETRVFTRTFIFPEERATIDEVPGSSLYSQAGTTLTRDSGTDRDFTADDVGRIVVYGSGEEAEITAFTNADEVEVDVSQTVASTTIEIYHFNTYESVAFSDELYPGNNYNILIPLASPVDVYPATPSRPSEQFSVQYELTLTVAPATATNLNLGGVISDSGNAMSGNKNGQHVIESYATSRVDTDGDTNIDFAILEPSVAGNAGYGTNSTALDPFGDVQRSGLSLVELTADDYEAGSFSLLYSAIWGLNSANSNSNRCLSLFDEESGISCYTFRFNNNQIKDSAHVLEVIFEKTWARVLS